ncbi:barstar family protein [Nocardioides sp. SOB77]|uniref:Barstar family protein n=1 Tax=Nocardioides oceani TaxID=3058369 RepID=A0ABT8FEI2_9ACTN|nr:barstar family protein [Nocardioides oceani]MDN4173009.1 barstar family protein [Nocardioides oceani]
MSGLAALLAGELPPAVYRWDAAYDVEEVRGAVELAGWRLAHLDGWSHPARAEMLEALGEALGLPAWWGRNLDALADCLRDVDTDRVALLWDGWGPSAREDARSFGVVLRLLTGSGIAVLLHGDGPEVDVPPLD